MFLVGDCFDHMAALPSGSVDMVLTDPPYFIDGMDDQWSDAALQRRTEGQVVGLRAGMKFDTAQGPRFEQFVKRLGTEFLRVLKPGGFCLVFSQARMYHNAAIALEQTGFDMRDMLCWRYPHPGQGKAASLDRYAGSNAPLLLGRKTPQVAPHFEPIALAQKPKDGTFVENWLRHRVGLIDVSGAFPSNIFTTAKPNKEERTGHPSQKPVALFTRIIEIFSKTDDVILDPFAGSGTTAIAAMNCGRNWICIERDPEYAAKAQLRIAEALLS